MDRTLSTFAEPFVTTVVLHDDAIPRLTPSSCRGLLKYLLNIRETWAKENLPDDIMAITDRAKSAWAPRWRGSFTLPTSSSSIKRYCRKHYQYGKKKLWSVREKLVGDESGQLTSIGEDETGYPGSDSRPTTNGINDNTAEEEVLPTLVLEFMGGLDATAGAAGVVIEGDEFFDAGGSLIEGDDEVSFKDCDQSIAGDETTKMSRYEQGSIDGSDRIELSMSVENTGDNETPEAVVLEETPLPRMFLPGKIVHLFAHRGVYKAAYAPRDFRELRRISLAGNMLSDHKCKSYYEALLEVRTARRATEAPPVWTAFDEDDTWYVLIERLYFYNYHLALTPLAIDDSSCCASKFTWASTSDSKAQEARDKHNCRSCGTLVCDPCSRNRVPLPSIGLIVSARVCDRCYNDIDGVFSIPDDDESRKSSAAKATAGNEHQSPSLEKDLPIRQRERRSHVVDDLAARVQTTPMTCT